MLASDFAARAALARIPYERAMAMTLAEFQLTAAARIQYGCAPWSGELTPSEQERAEEMLADAADERARDDYECQADAWNDMRDDERWSDR